jgi:excisionase family DNA binding protein
MNANPRISPQRPALVNVHGAAATLGIGVRTVWEHVERGELPIVRIGRRVLFDPADIDAFIAARRESGGRSP